MDSLENQLLIAMPSLSDPYFNKTVTYICEHNDNGAMGLIINLPINITLNDLLSQLEGEDKITYNPDLSQQVLTGGPVNTDRGFVLHSHQKGWSSSLALSDEIMITTSKDILLSLGTNNAPENYMVTLGYAGWEAGQLEKEMQENAWLNTPVDMDILFKTPIEERWKKATEKLGIDITHLSNDVGHA